MPPLGRARASVSVARGNVAVVGVGSAGEGLAPRARALPPGESHRQAVAPLGHIEAHGIVPSLAGVILGEFLTAGCARRRARSNARRRLNDVSLPNTSNAISVSLGLSPRIARSVR